MLSFCVPATAQWPNRTHGHTLGFTLDHLRRLKGIDTARDKKLDAMKFIWDPVMDLKQGCCQPVKSMYSKGVT